MDRWRGVDPGGLIHGPEAAEPGGAEPPADSGRSNLKSVAWAGCPRPGADISITGGETEVQRWETMCLGSHSKQGAEPGVECTSRLCACTSRFSVNGDWVVDWPS